MTKFIVTVNARKCQGYGACLKAAPAVFRLNADNKAEVQNASAADQDTVLPAARNCPYRAITVVDAGSGAQLFPLVKT